MTTPPLPAADRVLVSDFDGTIARQDFYWAFLDCFRPPAVADRWAAYQAGRLKHFEALRDIFGSVAPGEAALLDLLPHTDVDPNLKPAVADLRAAGWEVLVVSAGCHWYIDRILATAGVDLPVYANPGRVRDGRLEMLWPTDTPFPSPDTGIHKAAVVRWLLAAGKTVAFAGDGFPDVEAALGVPPEVRFARKDLADALAQRGERFRPFDRWAEVAAALVGGPA